MDTTVRCECQETVPIGIPGNVILLLGLLLTRIRNVYILRFIEDVGICKIEGLDRIVYIILDGEKKD